MKLKTLIGLTYVFQDFELRDYKTQKELGRESKNCISTVGLETYKVKGIYTRKNGRLVIQIEKPKRNTKHH